MINFASLLFSLLAIWALCAIGYYLVSIYIIMPRVINKYGEDDSRSKLWKAKVEKILHYKKIMIYVIGLAFSLLVLTWIVIQVKVLKVVP